jgi:hypothetical protein
MTATGKQIGGGWFSRGLLHVMLRRVTYDGQIAHRDLSYPGNHPAIIDRETFERVQALLADHRQGDQRRTRVSAPAMLAGIITDGDGAPLTQTHASKGKARYRYYVTRALHLKTSDTGIRVPARELEKLVATRIAAIFDDPIELIATAWLDVPVERITSLHLRCAEIAASLRSVRRETVMALVAAVRISPASVEIRCDAAGMARLLDVPLHGEAPPHVTLAADVRLARTGMAMRLVQRDGCAASPVASTSLIKQLLAARTWWRELRQGEIDITRLAEREKVTPSYITRTVRLAFLAPDVVEAILAGRQHASVDARMLTLGQMSPLWAEQRRVVLGAS